MDQDQQRDAAEERYAGDLMGKHKGEERRLRLTELVADFPDEYYEDLISNGKTNRGGERMTNVINQVLTWGQVKAMERSHDWTQSGSSDPAHAGAPAAGTPRTARSATAPG